jgi:hypothetical protein
VKSPEETEPTIEDEVEAEYQAPTQTPPIKSYPPPQNPRSPATPRRQTAAPKDIYQEDTIPPPQPVATPEDEAAILGYPTVDAPTPESVGWQDIGLPGGEDPSSLGMFGPELPPGYGEADPMQGRRAAYDQMLDEINNMELRALGEQQLGIDELEMYRNSINNLPIQTNLMPLMAMHESLFDDPSLAKHYNEPLTAAQHLQANLGFAPKVQDARENKTLRELDFKKAKIAARKALLDAEEQMLLKQAELASLEARKGLEVEAANATREDNQEHALALEGVRAGHALERANVMARGMAARDAAKPTEGMKAFDQAVGKNMSKYIEDRPGMLSNVASFESLVNSIEAGDFGEISGPEIGSLWEYPRKLKFPKAVEAGKKIEEQVVPTLKPLLGGAFTQKENEATIKRTYDPLLPHEVNVRRAKFVLARAKYLLEQKDRLYSAFQAGNGSLKGYELESAELESKEMAKIKAMFKETESPKKAKTKPSKEELIRMLEEDDKKRGGK